MGNSLSFTDTVDATTGGIDRSLSDALAVTAQRPISRPGTCYVHSFAAQPLLTDACTLMAPATSCDEYDRLARLGCGAFGRVYLVRRKGTYALYAMKSLSKQFLRQKDEVEHTKCERLVLGQIRHPFIVRLDAAFQTPTRLYMVMELVTGGELFYHLRKCRTFNEDVARFYLAEIVLALEYLHNNKIIYRDLKPENILLDCEGHIVLTDFGLSKSDFAVARAAIADGRLAPGPGNNAAAGKGIRSTSLVGTAEYVAPEIIADRAHGPGVDWWALGTLMYEMLVGAPPFFHTDVQEMYRRILTAPIRLPGTMSQEARSLIVALLSRSVAKRLGVAGGAEAVKRHPFFAGIDWVNVFHRRYAPPIIPAPPAPNPGLNPGAVSATVPVPVGCGAYAPSPAAAAPDIDCLYSEGSAHEQNVTGASSEYKGFSYLSSFLQPNCIGALSVEPCTPEDLLPQSPMNQAII